MLDNLLLIALHASTHEVAETATFHQPREHGLPDAEFGLTGQDGTGVCTRDNQLIQGWPVLPRVACMYYLQQVLHDKIRSN